MTRRDLLGLALAGAGVPSLLRAQQQQQPAAPAQADQLFDTLSLERRPAIVEETANDATVKAAELRLACPCPCTLDVFTCRTTDFTCSYSPARHKEVVALVEQGKGVEQVLDEMISKYGEEALMAPRPQGFNLVGYIVPSAVVLGVGAVIVGILALRQRAEVPVPVPVKLPGVASDGGASVDEIALVERELRDLES